MIIFNKKIVLFYEKRTKNVGWFAFCEAKVNFLTGRGKEYVGSAEHGGELPLHPPVLRYVVGANYLTTIVRNTKFFMFFAEYPPLLRYNSYSFLKLMTLP